MLRNFRIAIFITLAFILGCKEDLPGPDKDPKKDSDVQPLENVPELNEMVVYEVNPRAFSSSGTLSGITSRLNHIKSLGVNVLWVMPIYPLGEERAFGSPYCIKDYTDIDQEFGRIENLIDLVNKAHELEMAVILDWVANHTAWDHPWITENSDWYTKDSGGNIISPPEVNWTDVAELNFNSTAMQNEMIESMKFWVEEVDIDGFRCDAADFVPSSFWSRAISEINSAFEKDLIWLAEGGDPSNFSSGFEFNYGWDFYSKINAIYSDAESASSIFSTNTQEFSEVPTGKTKLRYITNHDIYAHEETPSQTYGEGQVGAFVVTAFMPGIPLIYNGQEVGHSSLISFFDNDPITWSQNPEILSEYQDLMEIWSGSEAVKSGALSLYSNNDLIVFKRVAGDEEVLVLVNTRNTIINMSLPVELQNTDWENAISAQAVNLNTNVSLGAYQYLVLKN